MSRGAVSGVMRLAPRELVTGVSPQMEGLGG